MTSPIHFVAFEGIEGSGKSTQAALADRWLSEQGVDHIFLREPGSTPLSEKIRELLLQRQEIALSAPAEALLYLSARAQLVEEVVSPALLAGRLVLADRYSHSTLAYQGYGLGLSVTELTRLCEFATGGLWPDKVILIDIPPQVGLARKKENGEAPDRIELRQLTFFERVREGYLAMAKKEPEVFCVIDGTKSEEEVWGEVRGKLEEWIRLRYFKK
jgi:dTMP kinase